MDDREISETSGAVLREWLVSFRRDWQKHRAIHPDDIDLALALADDRQIAAERASAKVEILAWAVLDDLEREDVPAATAHGRKLAELSGEGLVAPEVRNLAAVRTARVERLLGYRRLYIGRRILRTMLEVDRQRTPRELSLELLFEASLCSEPFAGAVPAAHEFRRELRHLVDESRMCWLHLEVVSEEIRWALQGLELEKLPLLLEEARCLTRAGLGPLPKVGRGAVAALGLTTAAEERLADDSVAWSYGFCVGFVAAVRTGRGELGEIARHVLQLIARLPCLTFAAGCVALLARTVERGRPSRVAELPRLAAEALDVAGPFGFGGLAAHGEAGGVLSLPAGGRGCHPVSFGEILRRARP